MDFDEGDTEVVPPYRSGHSFDNQVTWAAPDIPLNPFLREGFDTTPFAQRNAKEVADWLGKPYVVSTTLEAITWAEFVTRIGKGQPCITRFEFNLKRMKAQREWLALYPSGTCFEVRCLTRESEIVELLGCASDLDGAISLCRSCST